MSLRIEKKQATAGRILAVSRELFLQQGYGKTSVEEIAAAAGISRASLFNYYRGKPAILQALAASLEDRLTRLVGHYAERAPDSLAALEQLFAYAARVLDQTSGLTRLLLLEGDAELPRLQAAFTRLLEAGQRAGEVSTDFPARMLSETVYLTFLAGLLNWCREPDSELEVQFADRVRLLKALLEA